MRVEDIGTESITFANMRFRLVAPVPLLQVTFMEGGMVLEEGSAKHILDHPSNPRIEQFLRRFRH